VKTITEGSRAPDFELPDQDGNPVRLSDAVQDGPVVLFWYPVASSGGCTKEACHFRDLGAEFAAAGARRFGISTDPVASQKKFAESHGFDYPLLSDESGDVARSMGVKRKYVTPVQRATFVIDRDLTIRKVISSEMNMDVHADQALAALKGL
jgi:peroxiredoxin Q/BCP